MIERITRGYADLLRDLQDSDHPTQLQLALERAKASIDELERIITRLERIDQRAISDPVTSTESVSPQDRQLNNPQEFQKRKHQKNV